MEPARLATRLRRAAFVLLAFTSVTMAGCGGDSATPGTVTGTVYVAGHVTETVLAMDATVLAWRGRHPVAESPVQRSRGPTSVAPGGSQSAIGTFRLTLAPGRYVLGVGTAPPAGALIRDEVVVRAGATVARNLHVVFHPAAAPSTKEAPLHPYGLAVSPAGVLYVADAGRDQVLQYVNDTFTVVAGTGRQGFSGDGGAAIDADLRLTASSGLAVGNGGILYIADSGNDRVRMVTPDGTITTAVGDGSAQSTLAPSAELLTGLGPVSGLAFGRYRALYIAAQAGVAEMTSKIDWLVGSLTPGALPPCGVFCNPARQADFVGVGSLAFDAAGDLFCTGGPGSYGVYEDSAGGRLRYVGTFRGDGAPAALAEAPDGTVVMSYRGGVVKLAADGTTTLVTTLAGVLGTSNGHPNLFIGGDGLAVGPDGSVYVDTNTGNSFTTVSAIVRVTPTGPSPRVLWES